MEPSLGEQIKIANTEFIKGFILGQVILCILIFFFIKVFLLRSFRDQKPPKVELKILNNRLDSEILDKLLYIQKEESLEWFGVIVAQIIAVFRARDYSAFINTLKDSLAIEHSFIGPIEITEIHLGQEYPGTFIEEILISSCRIRIPSKHIISNHSKDSLTNSIQKRTYQKPYEFISDGRF